MYAWVKDGKVHFIVPSEHEPEEMGPLYKIKWTDVQTLDALRELFRKAQRTLNDFEGRLAAQILKENESNA